MRPPASGDRMGPSFRATDPLSLIASQNLVNPNIPALAGEVVSPRLEQPATSQVSLGWAREIDPSTWVSADYVRVDGRDLNLRLRPNAIVAGRRYLADVPIQPNSINAFRTAISKGSSQYDGLILAVRRRATSGWISTPRTLAKATSDVGTAYDEIVQNLIQDVTNPFGHGQDGPSTRTDARHRFLSAPSSKHHGAFGLRRCSSTDRHYPLIPSRARSERRRERQRQDGDRLPLHRPQRQRVSHFRRERQLRNRELQPACVVFAVEHSCQSRVPVMARGAH